MKLTDAQARAIKDAQANPGGLVAFDRRNDAGMAVLVEMGLVEEDFAYRAETIRVQKFAELRDHVAALCLMEWTKPLKLADIEHYAQLAMLVARDLQRKRHYLTEKGRNT